MDAAVKAITQSYDVLGGIHHIQGPKLPSRDDICALLREILSLLFPGYVTPAHELNQMNIDYFVGQRCSSIFDQLAREVEKSLRHECENSSHCDRPFGECYQTAIDVALGLLDAIPSLREVLHQDAHAAYRGDPAAKSITEVMLSYPSLIAVSAFRIAHFLQREGVPYIPRMMTEIIHGFTGIDIHPGACIGSSFFIDHGTGVVIGETTVIGNHVKIYQGVTLGALSIKKDLERPEVVMKRHPTIEKNVTIYAGATILGGETVVGEGSVIGGNVWLTHSIPPYTKVIIESPYQIFRDMKTGRQVEREHSRSRSADSGSA